MTEYRITVNPDVEYTKMIRDKIRDNNGYCPCKLIKNQDTKCMCKDFRDLEEGMCGCGLYLKIKVEC